MALPVLNDTPKYELTIPSTGKKVKFRPYLVKEEKVLMMASESGDIKQIMNAIVDTINACLETPMGRDELTTFDLEYLFLQIRSKSVGETVTISIKCDECESENENTINLEDIKCQGGTTENIIKINDEVALEMKYPSYSSIEFIEDETELGFQVLMNSIRAVLTQEGRIELSEEPKESVRNFLESMTQEQFNIVTSYVGNVPQVAHDVEFDCESCGHHNEVKITGMQSFF